MIVVTMCLWFTAVYNQSRKHVVSKVILVPRSVNLTGKRDNAGHEKTTVNKLAIIPVVLVKMLKTTDRLATEYLYLALCECIQNY